MKQLKQKWVDFSTWWGKFPMHIRITAAMTAVLTLALTLSSIVAYNITFGILKEHAKSRVRRAFTPEDDLFGQFFGRMTSPQDGMQQFGQQMADKSITELQTALLTYLIISTIAIVVLGAFATYFISKQSLQQLKRGFERTENFVSDASHELRTPLAVIKGQAELFKMKKGTAEEAKETLAKIEESANRMDRLLTDLLALSKLDQGVQSEKKALDLLPILRECTDTLRMLDPGREVKLNTFLTEAEVLANEREMWQVFLNLSQNIHRYTPETAPVRIDVLKVGNRIRVDFVDSGPGVATKDLHNIFNRFWTSSENRNREESGSGLGLAIVKDIVVSGGGTIRAEHTPGGGLTISVVL